MLSKEEYITLRDKEEVDIKLYYNYYLENKPPHYTLINEEDFKQIFETFLVHCQGKMILTLSGAKYIGMDRILDKIFKYFNKKWEL